MVGFETATGRGKGTGVFNLMKSMNVEPDVVTYNSLITAWSRNETVHSTKAVLDLFEKVEKQWRDGDALAKPNVRTYNAVIWALGKSRDIKFLDRAERLFRSCDSMDIERDVPLYTSLMSGWMWHSRSDKVEALFQEMKEEYCAGNESLKPQVEAYTVRLHAWSKAGNPAKTSEALNDWIVAGETEQFTDMPGTQAFTAVLVAWLRSDLPDAAEKAHRGLRQMMDLALSGRFKCFPDRYSFTVAISACAKSPSKTAGKRALKLLEELKSVSHENNDPSFVPDFFIYVDVMVTCFRSMNIKDGEDAIRTLFEELLSKEASFWQSGGRDDAKHNSGLLRRLRREFESSHFKYDELLSLQLEQVESIAKDAMRR